MLIGIAIATIAIFFMEGLPLARKKLWKELVTLLVLLVTAFLFALLDRLDLPTPLEAIDKLLTPVGKSIYQNFQQ